MRKTQSRSTWAETGLGLGLGWKSGFAVLQQLGVALIAVQACGEPAYLSSPSDLLETSPRAFAQWLQTNRPRPVSASDRTRILANLPATGEITDLDASSLSKLATLKPLLQAIGRDSTYEVKVIDPPFARIGLLERTVVLIPETALTLLEAEELQAQVAHESGHEYVWVDHARASAREDHRRLKDLELLCDAIAIATLHGLGGDPSRLMTGVEKVTRYNLQVLERTVDDRNYPTLSERRDFARAVSAWIAREESRPDPPSTVTDERPTSSKPPSN